MEPWGVVLLVAKYEPQRRHGLARDSKRLFQPGIAAEGHPLLQNAQATAAVAPGGVAVLDAEDFEPLSVQSSKFHGKVLGIVKLVPGRFYESILTPWNEEERLLWSFTGYSSDAVTVYVQQAWYACAPESCEYAWRGTLVHYARKENLSSLFLASLTTACTDRVLDGLFAHSDVAEAPLRGRQVLERLGVSAATAASLCSITYPLRFALPICRGNWRTLLWNGRSLYRRPRLFESWPSHAWWGQWRLQHPSSVGPQPMTLDDGTFCASRLLRIADELRSFYPVALASCEPEDRPDKSMSLQSDMRFLQDLAATIEGPSRSSASSHRFPADVLIQTLLMADLLRDGSRLRALVEKALPLVVPAVLLPTALARLAAGGIPKTSTTRRNKCLLDMAFALYMREILVTELPDGRLHTTPYFTWNDSSPMGGRDWFITHMHMLTTSVPREILCIARAVDALAHSSEALADDARRELSLTIAKGFAYHSCIPAGVGPRAGSTEHKAMAWNHQLQIETSSELHLACFRGEGRGNCSDMGAELSLTRVRDGKFWTDLAQSWRGPPLRGERSDEDFPEEDDAAVGGQQLYPRQIPIAGLLHIFDNMLNAADEELPWWSEFAQHLKKPH